MNKVQLVLSVLHQLRLGDIQEDIFSKKEYYIQTHKLQIENPLWRHCISMAILLILHIFWKLKLFPLHSG